MKNELRKSQTRQRKNILRENVKRLWNFKECYDLMNLVIKEVGLK
jgi:hypothetical protein